MTQIRGRIQKERTTNNVCQPARAGFTFTSFAFFAERLEGIGGVIRPRHQRRIATRREGARPTSQGVVTKIRRLFAHFRGERCRTARLHDRMREIGREEPVFRAFPARCRADGLSVRRRNHVRRPTPRAASGEHRGLIRIALRFRFARQAHHNGDRAPRNRRLHRGPVPRLQAIEARAMLIRAARPAPTRDRLAARRKCWSPGS